MAAPTFLMALQFVNLKLEISLDLKPKQFGQKCVLRTKFYIYAFINNDIRSLINMLD
jgi:hypothetical protein